MKKMKKWQKYLLIGLGLPLVAFLGFFAYYGLEAFFKVDIGADFSNWFSRNGWVLLIIVPIIVLTALIIGIYFGWKKGSKYFNDLLDQKVAERTGENPLIVESKKTAPKKTKPEDDEQGAVFEEKNKPETKEAGAKKEAPAKNEEKKDPGEFQTEEEDETKEVPPPAPPTPASEQEAGLKGILNELMKLGKRTFRFVIATLIALLLLCFILSFGIYIFWQRSNSLQAKVDTLQGEVNKCTDTNAFYQILRKYEGLMTAFGIPIQEQIDPEEVNKWNVKDMFTNLYCAFRANQPKVDKDYLALALLPKYSTAQKCTCNISPCTAGEPVPQGAENPTTDEKKPKYVCGDGACEKDKGENTSNCEKDCPKETKPGDIPKADCGNGIIEKGEKCDDGIDNNGSYGFCKTDCSGLGERCDDNICQNNHETVQNCPHDCHPKESEKNDSPPESLDAKPDCEGSE